METICHNCGRSVSADTPKCVYCGALIVPISNGTLSEEEGNRVIIPQGLSSTPIEERVSIKHKIFLKKESLSQDKSLQSHIIEPPIEEKKETLPPPVEEQKPIVEVPPVKEDSSWSIDKDIAAIFPSINEEIPVATIEPVPLLIVPPKVNEPLPPIEMEPITPLLPQPETNIDKTIKELVIPSDKETNLDKTDIYIDPLDIAKLFEEAKEKEKQVENFLQDGTPKEIIMPPKEPLLLPEKDLANPEKELYSVSDALKEIAEEEKKIIEFLEKPVISNTPPIPEKKEETPIPPPEKTEIFTPPKIEVPTPNNAPVGIEKIANHVPEKQGKPVVAWLIRHTENRKPIYYEIFEGDNVIGRGDSSNPVEIDVADDKYVSRGHAWIRAFRVPGNLYIFELRDDGAKRKDKSPSMNGTYLNASMRRIEPNVVMYLQDGDTVQVGITKLVFKVKPQAPVNPEQLFTDVLKSDYTITVIF